MILSALKFGFEERGAERRHRDEPRVHALGNRHLVCLHVSPLARLRVTKRDGALSGHHVADTHLPDLFVQVVDGVVVDSKLQVRMVVLDARGGPQLYSWRIHR